MAAIRHPNQSVVQIPIRMIQLRLNAAISLSALSSGLRRPFRSFLRMGLVRNSRANLPFFVFALWSFWNFSHCGPSRAMVSLGSCRLFWYAGYSFVAIQMPPPTSMHTNIIHKIITSIWSPFLAKKGPTTRGGYMSSALVRRD